MPLCPVLAKSDRALIGPALCFRGEKVPERSNLRVNRLANMTPVRRCETNPNNRAVIDGIGRDPPGLSQTQKLLRR